MIFALYLIIGILISTSIYVVADFKPVFLFLILFVAWLPLICVGMTIVPFIDVEEISNRLNT
ncbi:hypothetical protein J2S14_001827 [Lederbergia wuyishanensis]|uniref:NADH dehydrogenase subunit 6 n=1 Tax=Lederbergia wuyishanensis TaxID=1347903 RepID=A0ABU0D3M5_9BACI|nr:hypothetical protein [Lederbergia wuyishanensis]